MKYINSILVSIKDKSKIIINDNTKLIIKLRLLSLVQKLMSYVTAIPISLLHVGISILVKLKMFFSKHTIKKIKTLDFEANWIGDGQENVLLYAHGGGMCFGVANQCIHFVERLLNKNTSVLTIEYTLFDAKKALNEVISSYIWLSQQKQVKKIYFFGISAGGHLVLEAGRQISQNHKIKKPNGIIAVSPWIQPGSITPNPNSFDYVTQEKINECYKLAKPKSLLGSDWKNMPKTLIIYGELEYLRVQIESLVDELKTFNILVTEVIQSYGMHLLYLTKNTYKIIDEFLEIK